MPLNPICLDCHARLFLSLLVARLPNLRSLSQVLIGVRFPAHACIRAPHLLNDLFRIAVQHTEPLLSDVKAFLVVRECIFLIALFRIHLSYAEVRPRDRGMAGTENLLSDCKTLFKVLQCRFVEFGAAFRRCHQRIVVADHVGGIRNHGVVLRIDFLSPVQRIDMPAQSCLRIAFLLVDRADVVVGVGKIAQVLQVLGLLHTHLLTQCQPLFIVIQRLRIPVKVDVYDANIVEDVGTETAMLCRTIRQPLLGTLKILQSLFMTRRLAVDVGEMVVRIRNLIGGRFRQCLPKCNCSVYASIAAG